MQIPFAPLETVPEILLAVGVEVGVRVMVGVALRDPAGVGVGLRVRVVVRDAVVVVLRVGAAVGVREGVGVGLCVGVRVVVRVGVGVTEAASINVGRTNSNTNALSGMGRPVASAAKHRAAGTYRYPRIAISKKIS